MNSADSSPPKPAVQLTAVPLEMAAALLSKVAAQPITIEMLESTIGLGAPRNADGTLNLIHYTAWLVRENSVGH